MALRLATLVVVLLNFCSQTFPLDTVENESVLSWNCNEPSCNQNTDTLLQSIRNDAAYNQLSVPSLPGYCDTCTVTNLNQFYRQGSSCQGKQVLTNDKVIKIPLKNTNVSFSCDCSIPSNLTAFVGTLSTVLSSTLGAEGTCGSLTSGLSINQLVLSKLLNCNLNVPATPPPVTLQRANVTFDINIELGTYETTVGGAMNFEMTNYTIENMVVQDDIPQLSSLVTCLTSAGFLDVMTAATIKVDDLCQIFNQMLSPLTC